MTIGRFEGRHFRYEKIEKKLLFFAPKTSLKEINFSDGMPIIKQIYENFNLFKKLNADDGTIIHKNIHNQIFISYLFLKFRDFFENLKNYLEKYLKN
jgi:hypothetical protein